MEPLARGINREYHNEERFLPKLAVARTVQIYTVRYGYGAGFWYPLLYVFLLTSAFLIWIRSTFLYAKLYGISYT